MLNLSRFKRVFALTAALALTASIGLSAVGQAESTEKHFSIVEAAADQNALSIPEIAKKCRTSVVAIETETTVVYNNYDSGSYYNNPFGSMFGFPFSYGYGYGNPGSQQREYTQTGAGSGIILSEDGYILTNNHVISGVDKITVYIMPEEANAEEVTYEATLVGTSESNDIAVLKIDAPAKELTPIPLPEDNYEIAVGQKALVIGNPYGFDHTLTTGIISAIGRDQLGVGGVTIKDMIQTDASINPGNSGGPLLDSSGKLLGMNTMIFTTSGANAGIGFAVPFMTIKRVVPQIIKTGRAQQIGLGISLLQPSDAAYIARAYGIKGVIIKAVAENSPAAKAGLKGLSQNSDGVYLGDVILSIDGKPVANYNDLYTELDSHNPGDKVNVKIKRDQKEITVPVELFILPD